MNDAFSRYIRGLKNLRAYLKDNSNDRQLIDSAELLQIRLEREISEAQKFGGEPRDREINKILGEIIALSHKNTSKDFVEWCDEDHDVPLPPILVSSNNELPPDRILSARSNESAPQSFLIQDRLKIIYEQFVQCQRQAEQAGQHLAGQKHFTPVQGKRAIHFLSDLSDPTRDLCELFKHIPLPSTIASQLHSLSLALHELEKEKSSLQSYIYEEDKQEQVIYSVNAIIRQIQQIASLLEESLATTALPYQENSQLRTEPTTTNLLLVPLPEARKGNFDPRLGISRLYDLFKTESLPPPDPLRVLEARLERNLQKGLLQGQNPANSAEWAEILHSLIQLAATHLNVNFNDLCYP